VRQGRIESFPREQSGAVIIVTLTGGECLSRYEFDHLGDIIGSYLTCIGLDGVVGPKSIRTEMSDEELEAEFDDFMVIDNRLGRDAPESDDSEGDA
jgi:hypothetical protein